MRTMAMISRYLDRKLSATHGEQATNRVIRIAREAGSKRLAIGAVRDKPPMPTDDCSARPRLRFRIGHKRCSLQISRVASAVTNR
jgi:hypothetical protein